MAIYTARHSWVEILRSLNTIDKTNLTLGHFILFLLLLTFQKDMAIHFKHCVCEGLDGSLQRITTLGYFCNVAEPVPSSLFTWLLTWIGSRANSLDKGMWGVVIGMKGKIMGGWGPCSSQIYFEGNTRREWNVPVSSGRTLWLWKEWKEFLWKYSQTPTAPFVLPTESCMLYPENNKTSPCLIFSGHWPPPLRIFLLLCLFL